VRAPVRADRSCLDYFHALLVLETPFPGAAGSILHVYAVVCYHLQHPDGVGLTAAGLEGLRRNLADALDGEAPVEELRRRARLATDGAGYSRRQRAQIARGLDGVPGHDDSPFRTAKRRWVA
jgi:hypothetical protein